MRGYGKRHYHDSEYFILGYIGRFSVYRTFTPFSRRRHRALTTNKATERRKNRFAGLSALGEYN